MAGKSCLLELGPGDTAGLRGADGEGGLRMVSRRQVLAAGAGFTLMRMELGYAQNALIPLKVAYDGYSMTTAPMNYAVQKGIFKKYGLDVTLAYVDAGTTLSQAVVGGGPHRPFFRPHFGHAPLIVSQSSSSWIDDVVEFCC